MRLNSQPCALITLLTLIARTLVSMLTKLIYDLCMQNVLLQGVYRQTCVSEPSNVFECSEPWDSGSRSERLFKKSAGGLDSEDYDVRGAVG